MVVVSILPHAEFGPNDHREDAPHFNGLEKYQIDDNRFAVLSAMTMNGNVVELLHYITNNSRSSPICDIIWASQCIYLFK